MTQCHVDSHRGRPNWAFSDTFRPEKPDFNFKKELLRLHIGSVWPIFDAYLSKIGYYHIYKSRSF